MTEETTPPKSNTENFEPNPFEQRKVLKDLLEAISVAHKCYVSSPTPEAGAVHNYTDLLDSYMRLVAQMDRTPG